MTTRQINAAGLALIESCEGLELTAYQDPAGIWSIGYGHTPSYEGQTITDVDAAELLAADVGWACACVYGATHDVPTTDNQFSAMVSIAYNIGAGAFRSSSVLRLHREDDSANAARAFLLWDKMHVNGNLVLSAGLLRRRELERDLYLAGSIAAAPVS